MTKKEASEILEVAKGVVSNMIDVVEVEEVIEKLEGYKQEKGVDFTAEIYVWKDKGRTLKDNFKLSSYLSADDQVPLLKIAINLLREKKKKSISDFQENAGSFEKLAKEALNE